MWQTIQAVLTDGNFLKSIVGISILVTLLAFLAKKGIFSFKGKGLKVGHSDEDERTIIRTQIQWCEADVESMLREIVNNSMEEGDNIYKACYTVEKVLDELVKIVIFNHITLEPQYIKLKQDLIWSTVSKINPEPVWDKLEPIIRERVENAIRNLYEIRHYYNNSK